MKTCRWHIILFLLLISRPLIAQEFSDTVLLKPVTIQHDKTLAPPGFKTHKADSIIITEKQAGGIETVISTESAIYIKGYGPGSMSLVSFRGMGTNHTRILWNDLVINSSMNGTVDLTNLPAGLFSDVELQYGNSSLQTGSGGIGGGVQLITEPNWTSRYTLRATQEAGSFGTTRSAVKFTTGTSKWQSNTGLVFTKENNDFTFKNIALNGSPEQKQLNAGFLQGGAMQEFYGKLKQGHELSLKAWFTYTDREIPPTMVSNDNREGQGDILLFTTVGWKYRKGRHQYQAYTTYKFDVIKYRNELLGIDTASYTHTVSNIISYKTIIASRISLTARLENQNQLALTGYYDGGRKTQFVNGAFIGATYAPVQQVELLLYLRQELVDKELSPFLPSLGFNVIPSRKAGIKLNFNWYRNYRYPTLNDRYWAQGGNPNLDAETAMGIEGGISWNKDVKNWKLEANVTGYYMWVDNWILWQPAGAGTWSPVNVRKVISKGTEVRFRLERRWERWFLLFRLNYQFNIPTVAASSTGDGTEGKDLIYSPRHGANASLKVSYRGWYINYTQAYTGSRYNTSDNSSRLEPFTTGDITIGKYLKKVIPGLDIYLNIQNLWDADYQNIAWRAMPGRAYYAGIRYNWNKAL